MFRLLEKVEFLKCFGVNRGPRWVNRAWRSECELIFQQYVPHRGGPDVAEAETGLPDPSQFWGVGFNSGREVGRHD